MFHPRQRIGFHPLRNGVDYRPSYIGNLYEEYTPSQEELKRLEIRDMEFHGLLIGLFDLHIHLAYENKEKMVYHEHWLSRRPHLILWELFERQDFQPPFSASAMETFFSTYPMAQLELASYLALWLCKVVFTGRGSNYIHPKCFFSACRLAFGVRMVSALQWWPISIFV